MTISYNQNQTQAEKDYIRNLEEKNKILEKELQEMKIKFGSNDTQETKKQSENLKDYFTIGSTEDEVIKVMGDPISYMITASEAKKFHLWNKYSLFLSRQSYKL